MAEFESVESLLNNLKVEDLEKVNKVIYGTGVKYVFFASMVYFMGDMAICQHLKDRMTEK